MGDSTVEGEATGQTQVALDNWVIYGLFGGLTLAGVAVSTDLFGAGIMVAPADPLGADPVRLTVPLFVYVHATLGALGYVFTKLMTGLEAYDEPGEVRDVIEMGMRIPAAWVLGAGFYLVLVQAGNDPAADPHLFATVAFLVGLYVNVAIKSLGSIADRMLGRGRRS